VAKPSRFFAARLGGKSNSGRPEWRRDVANILAGLENRLEIHREREGEQGHWFHFVVADFESLRAHHSLGLFTLQRPSGRIWAAKRQVPAPIVENCFGPAWDRIELEDVWK
jgi:hypothetical protein